MNIKGIIDNWIISNIAIIGTIRGTNEQIFEPYSKWSKHPSMGSDGTILIAEPFTNGTIVGLMGRGMWQLGSHMINELPIIDHWVMNGAINPFYIKNTPTKRLKANGIVQGQYRGTKIEFVGHINPLFDAPWGDELKEDYAINIQDRGLVILGKNMSWHNTTITDATVANAIDN